MVVHPTGYPGVVGLSTSLIQIRHLVFLWMIQFPTTYIGVTLPTWVTSNPFIVWTCWLVILESHSSVFFYKPSQISNHLAKVISNTSLPTLDTVHMVKLRCSLMIRWRCPWIVLSISPNYQYTYDQSELIVIYVLNCKQMNLCHTILALIDHNLNTCSCINQGHFVFLLSFWTCYDAMLHS